MVCCCCLLIAIIIIVVVAILAIVIGSVGENGIQQPIAISSTTSFGNGRIDPDHNWPSCEDMNEFPNENIKLWKFHYQNDGSSLGSVKFEFTNGVMSPAVSGDRTAEQGFKVMTFDLTKTIGWVDMQIEQHGEERDRGDLNHIKFWSDEGELMGEERFGDYGGWWKTIFIPEGKEIIGFYCNVSAVPDYMQHLGFNLWTPPY